MTLSEGVSVSHVVVEDFFTTALQFVETCWYLFMHSSLRVPPNFIFNQSEVWTLTGSLQHLDSDLVFCCFFYPFCCRSAAVLGIIDGLTVDSRILRYTEFIVLSMTAMCPDPIATKEASSITPSPLCVTVGMRSQKVDPFHLDVVF